MRTLLLCFLLMASFFASAQHVIRGTILDSATRQALPFATVQGINEEKAVISKMDGRFSITLNQHGALRISYAGYQTRLVFTSDLKENDTILLVDLIAPLEELIIRPQTDKISRIINAAINNKPSNNPEQYKSYECNVYYKMIVDMVEFGNYNWDSIMRREGQGAKSANQKREPDTAMQSTDIVFPGEPGHLFITETYAKRLYKKPQQVQEIVTASKISGISQTWFANLVTNILPFHVYTDFINLNGTDYINPIAKGWKSRYHFVLEDEIMVDGDTVFILRYRQKNGTSFNALNGLVYINSDGYAISHFTGSNNSEDLSKDRVVKFEHIYQKINGKWFPQELNYDFAIRRFPTPYLQVVWNGHSTIDNASIGNKPSIAFDKAHPIRFSDSIDLHTEEQWKTIRNDTLTAKEQNTYRRMDSLMRNTPMESAIFFGARFATGRVPIGKFDLDIRRILARNGYEGTRLGLGLYTNNKISKYYSVGGWTGYGFKDKEWKYGVSATIYPKGDKENWISFAWQKNYKIPGEVNLHPELSRSTLRSWLLEQVDEFEELGVSASFKPGYWEIRPSFFIQKIGPLHYPFYSDGKLISQLDIMEGGLGFRYAFGEKRVPFFEYYLPAGTKYPIVYFSLARGKVSYGSYETSYNRFLAGLSFSKHLNRWGADQMRIEGGWTYSNNDQPLPRSLLLAGNGFRRSGFNFYAWGGFLTMLPFEFYSDRYISVLYRHDLDRNFWDLKWSKPYLSLAHNMVYGSLSQVNKQANFGLQSYGSGYQESGLVLNSILSYNLRFAEMNINTGVYYHWTNDWDWKDNGVWVIGTTLKF